MTYNGQSLCVLNVLKNEDFCQKNK